MWSENTHTHTHNLPVVEALFDQRACGVQIIVTSFFFIIITCNDYWLNIFSREIEERLLSGAKVELVTLFYSTVPLKKKFALTAVEEGATRGSLSRLIFFLLPRVKKLSALRQHPVPIGWGSGPANAFAKSRNWARGHSAVGIGQFRGRIRSWRRDWSFFFLFIFFYFFIFFNFLLFLFFFYLIFFF